MNYFDRHGCDTVERVIHRWAPSTENNTRGYLEHVRALTGFLPDQKLNLHSYEHVAALAKAIAVHEAGGWFFSQRDLDEGLRLAGIEPPRKPLSESRTMKAVAAGGTASVGLAAVGETIQQIDPALSIASRIADQWPRIACALLLVALAAVAFYRFEDWRELRR